MHMYMYVQMSMFVSSRFPQICIQVEVTIHCYMHMFMYKTRQTHQCGHLWDHARVSCL